MTAPEFDPYAAPVAPIEAPIVGPVLAGRWRRIAAVGLDLLSVGLIAAVASVGEVLDFGVNWGLVFGFLASVYGLILLAYDFGQLSLSGQTLGKKRMGVRIVRTDGTPVALGRLIGLRLIIPLTLVLVITEAIALGTADDVSLGTGTGWGIAAIPVVLGYLLFWRGSQKQAPHDLIADTIVILADSTTP